jgi:ABC-2 type transport system ATP-binding protein
MLLGYLKLELERTIRDLRYIVLAIGAPVGFYLLFSAVFGNNANHSQEVYGLPSSIEIMIAMATFGAMWAALSATAPRLARDREGGWLKFLDTTPIKQSQVFISRILAGLAVALPAIIIVELTAVTVHTISLSAGQWLGITVLLWIGTAPFIALGIAIGTLSGSTVAYALSAGLYFAFAALGGLWVPPPVLSSNLRHVAAALPSYNQAALGWHVASGTDPTFENMLVLVMWTVGLSLLPLVAHHIKRQAAVDQILSDSNSKDVVYLRGITKRYGMKTVVDSIDFNVAVGSTTALLGPNGAGKTTTIAMLLGLLYPSEGAVSICGVSPQDAAQEGDIGVMLQDSELMSGVRVGALLHFLRKLYSAPNELPSIIKIAGLSELLKRQTNRLSGGQAQRVRFALAIAGNPKLLVLDEPTAAMDVQARQAFWAALREYTKQGTTVLFSTHYLEEVDAYADQVAIINLGKLIANGTPEAVKANSGIDRVISFQLVRGSVHRFDSLAGVVSVLTNGDTITLHSKNTDATIWALYSMRNSIRQLRITDSGFEAAFLNLTSRG